MRKPFALVVAAAVLAGSLAAPAEAQRGRWVDVDARTGRVLRISK